jgi:hypothetical protein
MPATVDLWGDPIPEPPPPAPRQKSKPRRRLANVIPTDILAWLAQNEPQEFGELMDLRRALYSRKTHGKYLITLGGLTLEGEQKFIVTGPAGPLLIVSNKSRHFLLRTLCRLRRKKRWPPIVYR